MWHCRKPQYPKGSTSSACSTNFNYKVKVLLYSHYKKPCFSHSLICASFLELHQGHCMWKTCRSKHTDTLILHRSSHPSPSPLADMCMFTMTIKYSQCDLILIVCFHTLTQPWAMLEKPDNLKQRVKNILMWRTALMKNRSNNYSLSFYLVKCIAQAGSSTKVVICFWWCTVIITSAAAVEKISSETPQDFAGLEISLSNTTAVGEKLNNYNESHSSDSAHEQSLQPQAWEHGHTYTRCLPCWVTLLSERQIISAKLKHEDLFFH